VRGEPRWNLAPVTSDIEGEVVDCAVQPGKAVGVFVVVEGGAGLGEALVGEGVLELLHLGVFVEIVFLYFAVFILWSNVRISDGEGSWQAGGWGVMTYGVRHAWKVIVQHPDSTGYPAIYSAEV